MICILSHFIGAFVGDKLNVKLRGTSKTKLSDDKFCCTYFV